MNKYKFMFKGKNQEDCTREELLLLLDDLSEKQHEMIDRQVEYEVDRKTRDLEQELKIKDALIEKFISRS